MNTETPDNLKNKEEPYSISGFSDLINSPVFLAILLLTFILGLSSVFGFFQNPQKLRLIIELINQRVNISETKSHQAPNATISSYVKIFIPKP